MDLKDDVFKSRRFRPSGCSVYDPIIACILALRAWD